jgi:hypothetical protein
MTPGANPISQYLRARKHEIAHSWESCVRAEVAALDGLDRSALIDHMPEFIEGLAGWIEGDTGAARAGFGALAEGHALQRLGHGIDLATLTTEYMVLRTTILRELMAVPSSEQAREWMMRVNEGIDAAVHEAVRRYDQVRTAGQHTTLVRVDMGQLCRDVVDGRAIDVERSGDLSGMWDPDAVSDVLATVLSHASAVTINEASDHQAVIVTVIGVTDPIELPEPVRDRMIAHGGRLERTDDTLRLEWPRTPFAEAPERA